MAKKALGVVLSAKLRDCEIVVVESLHFPEVKTKYAAQMLQKLAGQNELFDLNKNKSILVAVSGKDDATRRAMRNIARVTVDEARNLNTYEVMQHKYILFPKEAIRALGK